MGTATRLSEAIHHHFQQSTSLVQALTGGLWTSEVPERTPFPYAWVDLQDITTHYNFVSRAEYARIFIYIYALGAEATEALAELWKSYFDECTLPFSSIHGFYSIMFLPVRYRLNSERLRHRDGQVVFRASLLYQTIVQRPRNLRYNASEPVDDTGVARVVESGSERILESGEPRSVEF